MNINNIKEAFFQLIENIEKPERVFVSLYIQIPYYGGPEEGGWWGADTHLVAYTQCVCEEDAKLLLGRIEAYTDDLNKEEKKRFGQRCLEEMNWLEARGLDADYLPEVDGESSYFVVTETTLGSNEQKGPRHYE